MSSKILSAFLDNDGYHYDVWLDDSYKDSAGKPLEDFVQRFDWPLDFSEARQFDLMAEYIPIELSNRVPPVHSMGELKNYLGDFNAARNMARNNTVPLKPRPGRTNG